jgi:hypothetical protein
VNWTFTGGRSAAGRYITVQPGNNSSDSFPGIIGQASYPFTINTAGTYNLWARMRTPSANDDSYWIKIDNGSWLAWNNIPTSTVWNWDFFHSFNLATGSHVLYVAYREDGTDLDKIYIGTDFPTDYGENAPTCNGRIDTGQGVDTAVVVNTIQLFPNPAHSSLSLRSKTGSLVVIFDANGRTVFSKKTKANIEAFDISQLQSGVYFVKVYDKGQHFSGKFIKN